jgi:FAD synthase
MVFELWERLRDEAAFTSEAELVAAIDADVRRTRESVRPA